MFPGRSQIGPAFLLVALSFSPSRGQNQTAARQTRGQASPDSTGQQRLLALIRREALRFQSNRPNFLCTQITVRRADPSGTGKRWKLRDTLEEELSYSDGHPADTVLKINGRPVRVDRSGLGGAFDAGLLDQGLVPTWVFGPQAQTEFVWKGRQTREGQVLDEFSFRVPPSVQSNPLGKKSYVVGFHGQIDADSSGTIRRLDLITDGPADYPIDESSWAIDYGPVILSGQVLVLPARAVLRARVRNYLSENTIRFVGYREYAADSTVTFGGPDR